MSRSKIKKRKDKTFRTVVLPAWTPMKQIMKPPGSEGSMMDSCWVNSRYEVYAYRYDNSKGTGPSQMVHLSFKQMPERDPFIPWRDKQRIKNEVLGPEWEGVELIPAESRLVDTSNQFHLWCFPPGTRLPMGFVDREVMEHPEEVQGAGRAVQTPWRDGMVPTEVQEERKQRDEAAGKAQ